MCDTIELWWNQPTLSAAHVGWITISLKHFWRVHSCLLQGNASLRTQVIQTHYHMRILVLPSTHVLVVHYVQTYIISWIQMWGREGVIMHRWQRRWLVSILFCMAMSCLQCTSLAVVGIDDSGQFISPIDHIHLVDCLLCSECPTHLDNVDLPACCTGEVVSNVCPTIWSTVVASLKVVRV